MKKTIKRILSMLVVIAMCSALFATAAFAVSIEVFIQTNQKISEIGDVINVTVNLNNPDKVVGATLAVEYDENVFALSNPHTAGDFEDATGIVNGTVPDQNKGISSMNYSNPGEIIFTFASANVLDLGEQIAILSFDLTVKNGAPNGNYALNVEKSSVSVNSDSGAALTATDVVKSPETIKVTADDDATLESLSVAGYALSPDFSSNETSYSIGNVPNRVTSLVINAEANNADAEVSITGNSNFEVGNNEVKVTVTAKDDATTKEYTIALIRDASTGGGGGGSVENTIKPTTEPKPSDVDEDKDDEDDKQDDNQPGRLSGKFSDLGSYSWALDAIDNLIEKEIVNGTSETTFEPAATVTRAQFAKMVALVFNLEDKEATVTFSDVKSGEWYYDYVMTAAAYEIITGYPDGTFAPDNKISREEMCVIMSRALAAAGYEVEAGEMKFADKAEISDWAEAAVAQLSGIGVIIGNDANEFSPANSATRAEAAVAIDRLVKYVASDVDSETVTEE